jgi:hypothetical protein
VLCLLYNAHRGKGPAKEPRDFNPYLMNEPREPDFVLSGKEGFVFLKKVFGDGGN